MSDRPRIEILPEHWQIVSRILQRLVPQLDVWAFGSRARFTAKKHSDLDLVVVTDQALPLSLYAAIGEAFSESDLPYRVDIVDWATTGESFRKIIERDKVILQHGAIARHGGVG